MNPTEAEIADMINVFDRDSKYTIWSGRCFFTFFNQSEIVFLFVCKKLRIFNLVYSNRSTVYILIENGTIDFCEFRDLVAGSRKDTDEDIRKAFKVSDCLLINCSKPT